MKDRAQIWEVWRKKSADRPARQVFIVTPRWVEARMIAQTVLGAEREEMEITSCSAYVHPEFIAKRGHEVYVAQYGEETKFLGAVKLNGKNA